MCMYRTKCSMCKNQVPTRVLVHIPQGELGLKGMWNCVTYDILEKPSVWLTARQAKRNAPSRTVGKSTDMDWRHHCLLRCTGVAWPRACPKGPGTSHNDREERNAPGTGEYWKGTRHPRRADRAMDPNCDRQKVRQTQPASEEFRLIGEKPVTT